MFTVTIFTPLGRGLNQENLRLESHEVKEALSIIRNHKLELNETNPGLLIKEELPETFLFEDEKNISLINGKRMCTAAITQMCISSEGWIYPCTTMNSYKERF